MRKINFQRHILLLIILGVFFMTGITYKDTKISPAKLPSEEKIPEALPTVGTLENLKKLIENTRNYDYGFNGIALDTAASIQKKASENAGAAAPDGSAPADYSRTNVQVEGVDEADVVKNDGKYIYQVNNKRVVIAKAYPAHEMKMVNTIEFSDTYFYPQEIYIDRDYMVLIGHSYNEIKYELPENTEYQGNNKRLPYYYGRDMVKIIVYDIKDRENIKEIRRAEVEGQYVSSRKIGTKLYIVSNKGLDYYLLDNGIGDITPLYKDSAASEEYKNVPLEKICYIPDTVYQNYMLVGAFDISDNKEMKLETILGAGESIYVSAENLYAAVTKYGVSPLKDDNPSVEKRKLPSILPPQNASTLLYKFALKEGNIAFAGEGEVPGRILNQFSMDEYNKYFRIATTSGETWQRGGNISKNNIYVLNSSMEVKGKIEDIAPGERIYSVRFLGERGYLVTFETVDPLFVVDLKNPEDPKILGALKIPGYSNYLHPYDENHLIGFGKDTIVLPVKDSRGNVVEERAYYMGMKVAIFDATDVNNPVEKFSMIIGDRGTDSPLLYDHKALVFSKEKNLLAFPVTLYELQNGQDKINTRYNYPEYGTFTYQGAYIYNIDLVKGFTLKGRITHMDGQGYQKAGKYWQDELNTIERILYIDNTLYTLSKGKIIASDINNLKTTGEIDIPPGLNY